MSDRRDRPDTYYNIDNIHTTSHFLGIEDRNIIETIVFLAIIFFVYKHLPFIREINLVICVVVGLSGSFLTIFGIKNESLTEFLISLIIFKSKQKKLHYRRVDDVSNEKEEIKRFDVNKYIKDIEGKLADRIENRAYRDCKEKEEASEG